MLNDTTRIDGLSHPYIDHAYYQKDQDGNTLIIDTKFSNENKEQYNKEVMSFLSDIESLIGLAEKKVAPFQVIDIRLGTTYQ